MRAQYPFVADPRGELAEAFGVRVPILVVALRRTFVIRPDRTIMHVDRDEAAVDPTPAIRAVAAYRDARTPRW